MEDEIVLYTTSCKPSCKVNYKTNFKCDMLNNCFNKRMVIFTNGKIMSFKEKDYLFEYAYDKDLIYNNFYDANQPSCKNITGDVYICKKKVYMASNFRPDLGLKEVDYITGNRYGSIYCLKDKTLFEVHDDKKIKLDKDVICVGSTNTFAIYSKPSGTYIYGSVFINKEGHNYKCHKVSDIVFDQIMGNGKYIIGHCGGKFYVHRLHNIDYIKQNLTFRVIDWFKWKNSVGLKFGRLDIQPTQLSFNGNIVYYQLNGDIYRWNVGLVRKNATIITNRNTFTLVSSRFYATMLYIITGRLKIKVPKMIIILILKTINSNLRYQNGKLSNVVTLYR